MTSEMVKRSAGWLLWGALAVLLVAIATACGSDPTATPITTAPAATPTSPPSAATATPTPSKAAWEIKWDETLAAAQEEGELIWGKSPGSMPPVIEHFGEKFGIKITLTTGSSSELIERVLAERAAGKYELDFFWAGVGTTNRRMIPNNMLVPVLPHLFLPEVLDESLWYRGQLWWAEEEKLQLIHSGRAGTLNLRARYNTNLVSEEEAAAITSVWDYLNPKWKGQITAFAPEEGVSGVYSDAYVHPDIGPAWLEKFFNEMDVTFVSDPSLLVNGVARGGFAWCLMCGRSADADMDSLAEAGLPIAPIGGFNDLVDAKAMATASGAARVSVIDRVLNPNAHDLFLNWFLSQEGQTMNHILSRTDSPGRQHDFFTLREDVTEQGNVIDSALRVPGQDYIMFGVDPDLLAPADAYIEVVALYEARGQ